MAVIEKPVTILSTKGQVILPNVIRDSRRWRPGTRFTVEETPEGILLKAVPIFAPTKSEDVYGCLPYKGTARTLKEMDDGITEEARARHARGRY